MSLKFYISNISPLWPEQKQLDASVALTAAITFFKDDLKQKDRRAQRAEKLVERENMFRPTSRNTPEFVCVAALPCLAFSTDDFIYVLTKAAQRNATIRALDTGMEFTPCKRVADLHRAARIFADTKAKAKGFQNGQLGGLTSAANKQAVLKAAAELARPYWHLDEPSNIDLAKTVGASVNGLKGILGPREDARRKYQAAQKRKAKKAGAI